MDVPIIVIIFAVLGCGLIIAELYCNTLGVFAFFGLLLNAAAFVFSVMDGGSFLSLLSLYCMEAIIILAALKIFESTTNSKSISSSLQKNSAKIQGANSASTEFNTNDDAIKAGKQ